MLLGYTNLSLLYNESNQYKQALIPLRKALDFAIKCGEQVEIAKVWNNLGLIYLNMERYVQAKKHFEQAQSLFVRMEDNLEIAKTQHNLGLVNIFLEESRSAWILLSSAQQTFEQSDAQLDEIKVLIVLKDLSFEIIPEDNPNLSQYYESRLEMLINQNQDDNFQQEYTSYRRIYKNRLLNKGIAQ